MSLTPTEREEHFFKSMVDAADGSTPEELEPTERREHWYKEIIDAIKSGGGGSGGGVLVVTDTDGTLDKTWQEIHDAGFSVLAFEGMYMPLRTIGTTERDGYYVKYWIYDEIEYLGLTYSTESASGYPTQQG